VECPFNTTPALLDELGIWVVPLVLQNQSPFECLFHCTPDYDFLRTFGCLFFFFCIHTMLISWISVNLHVCF
jgi:hypothetical protein